MNNDYDTILKYLSGNLSVVEQEKISDRLDKDSAFLELYSKVQIAKELLLEQIGKDEINQFRKYYNGLLNSDEKKVMNNMLKEDGGFKQRYDEYKASGDRFAKEINEAEKTNDILKKYSRSSQQKTNQRDKNEEKEM